MLTIAVRVPVADGSKVIWKLVLPIGLTGDAGNAVTVKSEALAPEILTTGLPDNVKLAAPVF